MDIILNINQISFCYDVISIPDDPPFVTISSESQQNKGVTTHHSQLIGEFINWYKSGQH